MDRARCLSANYRNRDEDTELEHCNACICYQFNYRASLILLPVGGVYWRASGLATFSSSPTTKQNSEFHSAARSFAANSEKKVEIRFSVKLRKSIASSASMRLHIMRVPF